MSSMSSPNADEEICEGYDCEEPGCDRHCPVDADDHPHTIYYGGHQMSFCNEHYETGLRYVVEECCAGLSDETLVRYGDPSVGDVGCWRRMLANHLESK